MYYKKLELRWNLRMGDGWPEAGWLHWKSMAGANAAVAVSGNGSMYVYAYVCCYVKATEAGHESTSWVLPG